MNVAKRAVSAILDELDSAGFEWSNYPTLVDAMERRVDAAVAEAVKERLKNTDELKTSEQEQALQEKWVQQQGGVRKSAPHAASEHEAMFPETMTGLRQDLESARRDIKTRDAEIAELKARLLEFALARDGSLAEARREEREACAQLVMTHALVQGRYSEQAERNNQPAEAKEYWQAYRTLKLAVEDLRADGQPASAPEGAGGEK